MLKITTIPDGPGTIRLKLDGNLSAEAIEVLERTVRDSIVAPVSLVLDLSGVTFVGSEAVELLRTLEARGVVLAGASPFVNEQLRG